METQQQHDPPGHRTGPQRQAQQLTPERACRTCGRTVAEGAVFARDGRWYKTQCRDCRNPQRRAQEARYAALAREIETFMAQGPTLEQWRADPARPDHAALPARAAVMRWSLDRYRAWCADPAHADWSPTARADRDRWNRLRLWSQRRRATARRRYRQRRAGCYQAIVEQFMDGVVAYGRAFLGADFSRADLCGRDKHAEVALLREAAMSVLYRPCAPSRMLTVSEIAVLFDRDHSTVCHAWAQTRMARRVADAARERRRAGASASDAAIPDLWQYRTDLLALMRRLYRTRRRDQERAWKVAHTPTLARIEMRMQQRQGHAGRGAWDDPLAVYWRKRARQRERQAQVSYAS